MNRTPRRRTALAALPVALLAAAALSACSPVETDKNVPVSDGINVMVGDVHAINLMILTAAQGDPGSVHGALTNTGQESATVKLAAQGATPTTITLDGGETVYVGPPNGKDVELASTAAAPGATLPVTISVGDASSDVRVPVLDGTLPEYSTLVPTPPATS